MLNLKKEMICALPNGINVVNITSESMCFKIVTESENNLFTIAGYDIGLEIDVSFIPTRIVKDVIINRIQYVTDPVIQTMLSEFSEKYDCFILGTENMAMSYPGTIFMPVSLKRYTTIDPWFMIYKPNEFISFWADGNGMIKLSKMKEE